MTTSSNRTVVGAFWANCDEDTVRSLLQTAGRHTGQTAPPALRE
ncbi:MAG: hypothetical protein QOI74_3647 [Micromonosporaceae bacterium]|jgi:hypothetical protein|nr:hypothetical protein [Micromonosporaceae bacterium]